MVVYAVCIGSEVTTVSSLRKAKALAGKTGFIVFPNAAIASSDGLFKNAWPTEHSKLKKCGSRPLVRKPKQTDKFLLAVRERLQKLLDGAEGIGPCGICAYLSWFNTTESKRKDDHGYYYCYHFVGSMIDMFKASGWNFYCLKEESGEYDGFFGKVRRELATRIIKLIDADQLKKADYGYKMK